MSISYVDDISDGRGIFIFIKLLSRWKGSLYKLVWIDLVMYIFLYYVMSLSYRFGMNEAQKNVFKDIVKYCEKAKANIPLSFLLGFFVAGVIARWYQMYILIPWMNKIAFTVMSIFPSHACMNNRDDEFIRRTRLTIMRYVNLSWILAMRQISDQIAARFQPKKEADKELQRKRSRHAAKIHEDLLLQDEKLRLPSNGDLSRTEEGTSNDPFDLNDHESIRETLLCLNDDKKVKNTFKMLITEAEIKAFENISHQCFAKNRVRYTLEYWVPMVWAVRVIQKATLHGMVADPKISFAVIDEIGKLRQQMQDLQVYSSIMIPLVYTQVVIIAAYSYFLCQIFSTQFVDLSDTGEVDFYFPIFSVFSFLFSMGWLKVAMCVMNPFGDDDEDFQTSDILDYNLEVSYRCVEMDEKTYPDGLSPPDTSVKLLTGHDHDDLETYLNQTSEEMENVEVPQPMENVQNLELNPGCGERLLNCFTGNDNGDEAVVGKVKAKK